MIRVSPQEEPANFDPLVRQPGLRALAEMVGEKPERNAGNRFNKIADDKAAIPPARFPAYWQNVLEELMGAYNQVCAYSSFRIHEVTGARSADHFACKSRSWQRVYEWSNYRLACSKLNSRKRDFDDVLDPFEIQDGWFQLELVGFQVLPAAGLDEGTAAQVRDTICRLGLQGFRGSREKDAEDYWAGEISLNRLQRESPFVAKELQRQGRLLQQDA